MGYGTRTLAILGCKGISRQTRSGAALRSSSGGCFARTRTQFRCWVVAAGSVALCLIAGCSEQGLPLYAFGIPGGQTDPAPTPTQYTLTVSTDTPFATVGIDERGFVNTCPRQAGFPCDLRYFGNEILTLQAHPPAGWRFDRWSGCEVSRNATIVIRMPQRNVECQAHFHAFDDGFDVTVLPQRVLTAPGVMATSQLAIERGANFAGVPLDFQLVDPPSFISLAAPAAGVTVDSVALALNVPNGVAPGHYLVTLRAQGQNRLAQIVARTVTLAVDVASTGDFYVSLDTPTLSISPGTSCAVATSVYRDSGFADPVNFTASALPQGVSASFDPNPTVGNGARWVLTADAQAPFSEQEVNAAGHAGPRQRLAALRLAVTAARDSCASGSFAMPPVLEDFSISLNTTSVTLPQGEITAVDIAIDRGLGYLGEVFFTAAGAPPGTFAKFEFGSLTFGNRKRLILLTSPTAPLGTFDVDVTATGGGRAHTARLTVQITAGSAGCPLTTIADSFASAFWTSPPPSTILEVSSRSLLNAAKTYLAFDVANQIAPPFDKVELVISLLSNDWAQVDPDGTRTVLVRGITDNNDWAPSLLPETALNWSNAPKNDPASDHGFLDEGSTPGASARALGSFVVLPSHAQGTLYRVDVTDYMRWALGLNTAYSSFAARDADGIVTFMLGNNRHSSIGSSDYTLFHPRESPTECGRPHLEVYQ